MITRFKLASALVLGLALVSGAVTDASARSVAPQTAQAAPASKMAGKTVVKKTVVSKSMAGKTHRIHVARVRHAHKVRLAHKIAMLRLAGAKKTAGTAKQHQAMAHRIGSVIR